MDHKDAVRLKATERYLLNELDPDLLDQFEEHLFDCQECALDVRAGAMFVEQSKNVLTETPQSAPTPVMPSTQKNWLSWLRPAVAVPVMALLLAVVAYQNLMEWPAIKSASALPEIVPYATMNIATRGATVPVIAAKPGQNFSLLVDVPPDGDFSSYIADLYNPAGKIEWSLAIPAAAVANDSLCVRVPGTNRPGGVYVLALRGIRRESNGPSEIGRHSFELRLQ